MNKLRICFVMHYFYREKIGGAEVQAFMLARELSKLGHEVHYVAQSLSGKQGSVEEIEGVKIHWIKSAAGFHMRNTRSLRAKMRCIDADVYYNRIASSYTGIVADFCRKYGKKFFHACAEDMACERDYIVHLASKARARSAAPWPKKLILRFMSHLENRNYYRGLGLADSIIVQNDTQAAKLEENFGYSSVKLYSGHEIPPEASITKDQVPAVVWISSFGKRKQPQLFFELAHACAELDCKFLMAGKPSSEFGVDKIGLLSAEIVNFEYLGEISFDDSNELLRRSVVYVNTSEKDREGLPNAMIQAMLRMNVILTLHTDPDQMISSNDFGHVCRESAGLVKQLFRMIQDPDAMKSAGKRAREFAVDHFSINTIARQLEEVLANEN